MFRSTSRRQALTVALIFALPLGAYAQAAKTPPAVPPAPAAKSPPQAADAKKPMQLAASYDPALYSALRYRTIGPLRGGRVTAVTGVPTQP